jgi:Bacterial antitoxin of type II TA system, VapB
MVTHMKTTIEVSDAVLTAAKSMAAREGTTVRALVEEGLRKVLEERRAKATFRLRKTTFRGRGLRPEVREGGWEAIRELAYEGRGS